MIEKMRREHQELLSVFSGIRDCVRIGPKPLIAARERLLGHLRAEDEGFYPALRQAARTDAELARLLEVFDVEMADVSKAAELFFAKYKDSCESIEFTADFERLYAGLRARIAKEENILFAEYQRRTG